MSRLREVLASQGRDLRAEAQMIRPTSSIPSQGIIYPQELHRIGAVNKLVPIECGAHSQKKIVKGEAPENGCFIETGPDTIEDIQGHQAALESPLAPFVPPILLADASRAVYVVPDCGVSLRTLMRAGQVDESTALASQEELIWRNVQWIQHPDSSGITRVYSMNRKEWKDVKPRSHQKIQLVGDALEMTAEEFMETPIITSEGELPLVIDSFRVFDEVAAEKQPRYQGKGIWDNDLSNKNITRRDKDGKMLKVDFGMVGIPHDIAEGVAVATKGGNCIDLTDVSPIQYAHVDGKLFVRKLEYKNPEILDRYQQHGEAMIPALSEALQYPDLGRNVFLYRAMNYSHALAYSRTNDPNLLFFQIIMMQRAMRQYNPNCGKEIAVAA